MRAVARGRRRAGSRPATRTPSQYASDAIRVADRFLDPEGVFRHSIAMLRQDQGNLTDNMRL
jgi:hypothetical protein